MTTDKTVAEARRAAQAREQGYRAQALKLYPWICGRCRREFTHANLHLLTVHHRDHNHDHNPPDGSNWELLCVYCHDDEHARHVDRQPGSVTPGGPEAPPATHKPFAGLEALLTRGKS